MKNITSLLPLLSASLAACATHDEPLLVTGKAYQQQLVAGIVPAEPDVISTRSVVLQADAEEDVAEPEWMGRAAAEPTSAGESHTFVEHFVVGDTFARLLHYERVALDKVGAQLTARGVSEPTSSGAESLDSGVVPKSWSNAIDSRQDLSTLAGAEYDRIGLLAANGNCTATLVGRRLIVTNAHCVINSSGNYVAGTFRADPRGTASPFAAQNVVQYWVGGNYISGCINGSGTWASCVPEDWAILLLQDSFPNGHPGWHGYAWDSNELTYTSTWNQKRVHGFPGCGSGGPSGCPFTYPRLYGQTFNCTIGDFRYPFSGGYNSTFSHGCDTSAGQSGAAILERNFGYVLGVHSTSMCNPTTCANETDPARKANPNLAKRFDSFIHNLLNNLRASYP